MLIGSFKSYSLFRENQNENYVLFEHVNALAHVKYCFTDLYMNWFNKEEKENNNSPPDPP